MLFLDKSPLPHVDQLDEFLSLRFGGSVKEFLPDVLLTPIQDLMVRPGKQFRGRLTQVGFDIARTITPSKGGNKENLQKLSQAIEYLHSGSLAVDDLQDGSKIRRGYPTLHLKYGLPIALNTGNWLYFWPLEMMQQLNLHPLEELQMYRHYHRTLIRAHVGQALDVGVSVLRVPQEKVAPLCLSSIELKSGALFSLALVSGAILAGAKFFLIEALDQFGHGFGMGLQMFDDIGNIKGNKEPIKRWEDLILRRPTWIWGCAAASYTQENYDQFVHAVLQLPQDRRLLRWIEHHKFLEKAQQQAHDHLHRCFRDLEETLKDHPGTSPAIHKLKELAVEVTKAYA